MPQREFLDDGRLKSTVAETFSDIFKSISKLLKISNIFIFKISKFYFLEKTENFKINAYSNFFKTEN